MALDVTERATVGVRGCRWMALNVCEEGERMYNRMCERMCVTGDLVKVFITGCV